LLAALITATPGISTDMVPQYVGFAFDIEQLFHL